MNKWLTNSLSCYGQRPMTTVDEWNQKHPPGTPVSVILDDGSLWQTETRSEAWRVGSNRNGHNVVLLNGKSGGYALHRVHPLRQ